MNGTAKLLESLNTWLYFLPVTGLAASFSPVPTQSELKKCEANFFKGEKAAAFQSYPLLWRGAAGEASQPAGCGGKKP
jgi:hypothetical protein